ASAWGNGRYVRAEPVCREKVRDANGRGRVLVNPAEFGSSARVLQWAAWADSGRHGRANRCANGVRSCAKFSPQMSRPYMLEHKLRAAQRPPDAYNSRNLKTGREREARSIYSSSQGRSVQRSYKAGRFSGPHATRTFSAFCTYAAHDLSLRIFRDARSAAR